MNATNDMGRLNAYASRIGFESENERLLEKLLAKGVEVRSFDGWKDAGKWVKKGEKRKAFRVQSGSRRYEVPGTGEERYEPIYKICYGFTADQVK